MAGVAFSAVVGWGGLPWSEVMPAAFAWQDRQFLLMQFACVTCCMHATGANYTYLCKHAVHSFPHTVFFSDPSSTSSFLFPVLIFSAVRCLLEKWLCGVVRSFNVSNCLSGICASKSVGVTPIKARFTKKGPRSQLHVPCSSCDPAFIIPLSEGLEF